MVLKVYNNLTEKLEEFKPIEGNKVKMYVCGLTPQDYAHIGHARTYIAFDVIKRYLKFRGFEVIHVQNITDVEDKIIAKAKQQGVDPMKLASRLAAEASKDLDALGIERANVYPRVTEHMEDIVRLVARLIRRGYAYAVDGDVYFSVRKFPKYGALSHQSPKQILAGARVEVDERKKDPADFALWKRAKEGEPSFDSPWGPGRPGWHIECSAMSMKYLGERLDIHGGAKDLVFPHHENEIAQSEAATGKAPFVKYWLHTGFLNVAGEKMSKSLGNFITIRDLLEEWDPDVFRLFVVSTHYSSPIDFSEEVLEQAEKNLARLRNTVVELERQIKSAAEDEPETGQDYRGQVSLIETKFLEAMDNDFNTPQAIVALQDLAKLGNKALSSNARRESLENIIEEIRKLAAIIGLSKISGGTTEKVEGLSERAANLIKEREEARKNGNWGKADEIRDQLKNMGIMVEDTSKGPKWRFDSQSSEIKPEG
ncbi:MAG: cysteine--tRNA ligase [Promethearchaeati archaeon SRVP18_Atabeyarchaeia-1]